MFTKKHMIEIARIVRNIADSYYRKPITMEFAKMLSENNPNFDVEKFYIACDVKYNPKKKE